MATGESKVVRTVLFIVTNGGVPTKVEQYTTRKEALARCREFAQACNYAQRYTKTYLEQQLRERGGFVDGSVVVSVFEVPFGPAVPPPDLFVAPTPRPYTPYSQDEDSNRRQLVAAQALWHVMSMLGISAVTAYEKSYSLNQHTFDDLDRMAADAGRHDVVAFLRAHGWVADSSCWPMFEYRPEK